MEALKPILIIPLVSSLIVGLAMIYLIGKPVAGILAWLTHWLQTMGTANAVLLGAILGAMMCTDMGGPVNKAAYAFGVGLLSTQTYAPMAAIMAAGMVPPLAMGIATLVARNKFDKGQREGGKAALVLGLCFISEGAIPFAARDPMRVLPCCIVGGAVTGAIHGGRRETDGAARRAVCSADPGGDYAGAGLPAGDCCRNAGGGPCLRRAETP